jgi:ketosteroid isomerase-like protein
MTPREVFAVMRQGWLDGTASPNADIWAEDMVIEQPFAAPGRPKRVEGRDKWRQVVAETRPDPLPVTFEECTTIAIHDTIDPDVIVVEYELVATVNATGERGSAQFIGVLAVRDGKAALWREYQNTMVLAAAGF